VRTGAYCLAITDLDYVDYRDAGEFTIPCRIATTWVNGGYQVELDSVRVNVPMDASIFRKPAAPKANTGAKR
jgi:hypothetical protein